jgi:hypothetical protein
MLTQLKSGVALYLLNQTKKATEVLQSGRKKKERLVVGDGGWCRC